MDFNIENFSYRLTILLEENNMNQTELAKKIGTTNVTICRYLTCERIPRLDVVAKIASLFNVSLDYLLGLSEDRTIKNSSGNNDIDIAMIIKKLYCLKGNEHLSKKQLELIKNLLLANKNFILSA